MVFLGDVTSLGATVESYPWNSDVTFDVVLSNFTNDISATDAFSTHESLEAHGPPQFVSGSCTLRIVVGSIYGLKIVSPDGVNQVPM